MNSNDHKCVLVLNRYTLLMFSLSSSSSRDVAFGRNLQTVDGGFAVSFSVTPVKIGLRICVLYLETTS